MYIYIYVYIGWSRLLELRKPEYDWGVGWGGMLTFMWTCGSSWCYAHAGWGGVECWRSCEPCLSQWWTVLHQESDPQTSERTASWEKQESNRGRHAEFGWLLEIAENEFAGVKSSCEAVVDARVAQSQWHHWIGNKDPWKTQGEVLKAVRDLQLLWRNRKKTGLTCFWWWWYWWWWWWWWWWTWPKWNLLIPRRNFVTEWTSFTNLIQVYAVPEAWTRLYIHIYIYTLYIYIHLCIYEWNDHMCVCFYISPYFFLWIHP